MVIIWLMMINNLVLVGGIPIPLWKIMELKSVGMMTFPTEWTNKIHVSNHKPDNENQDPSWDFGSILGSNKLIHQNGIVHNKTWELEIKTNHVDNVDKSGGWDNMYSHFYSHSYIVMCIYIYIILYVHKQNIPAENQHGSHT